MGGWEERINKQNNHNTVTISEKKTNRPCSRVVWFCFPCNPIVEVLSCCACWLNCTCGRLIKINKQARNDLLLEIVRDWLTRLLWREKTSFSVNLSFHWKVLFLIWKNINNENCCASRNSLLIPSSRGRCGRPPLSVINANEPFDSHNKWRSLQWVMSDW